MSFSEAIAESQKQAAAKGAKELRADIRKNGVPEQRDLGALRHLRELYAELPGSVFDLVLREESSKQVKFKRGR